MPSVDWGVAGTATVVLIIPNESGTFSTNPLDGYLVKNDANLKSSVEKNIHPSDDRNKLDNSKYVFYSPVNHSFEGKVAKAVISHEEISKNQFTSVEKQKAKACTVKDPLVIAFGEHFFLCCDSEDLNKSKFLEKYSKVVRNNQTLDPKNVYGLGMNSEKHHTCIPFQMSHESQSNTYKVHDRVDYGKLKESGPLLKDKKTIVGCYRKSNAGNCQIEIKLFGQIQASIMDTKESPEALISGGNGLQSFNTLRDRFKSVCSIRHRSSHKGSGFYSVVQIKEIEYHGIFTNNHVISNENEAQQAQAISFVLTAVRSLGKEST